MIKYEDFRRGFEIVYKLFLPPVCYSCRAPVVEHGGFCSPCWQKIKFITPPYCDRLGIPFPYDPGCDFISPRALANPPFFERARGAFIYEDFGRSCIHQLKYGRQLHLVKPISTWMMAAGKDVLLDCDILIPIPLSWRRLWARRFNQATKLAENISKMRDIPISYHALQRIRHTRTQVGLAANQRAKNVSGAFSINLDYLDDIAGKNCLLVDDVFTSGATANACTKTLLKAGAKKVDILVAAIVCQQGPEVLIENPS